MAWRGLSKQQWEAMRGHLPQSKASARGGRPRIEDRRGVEGILWILWTGAQWRELPKRYGSPRTCWRRLKHWEETGILLKLWRAFLAQLNDQEKLRWDECIADGRVIPAKTGGKVGKTTRGKGTQGMVLVDGTGTPLGAYLEAASPAEVTLLERTLDTVAVGRPGKPGCPRKRPERLIAERGDDSHPLREHLVRRGIEPIIPVRRHHKRATHQDGRKLRRYRRRWIVERTFAWLGNFRRLVVRYERLLTTDAGFFHLACALLTLRRVLK
jgi:transposase